MTIHIEREGFGQLEPNHISAPRDGRVYAQLPAAEDIELLEQGSFVKYDYAAGECNFTGEGPWMMVYNEEKLYDERKQNHKHFALEKNNFYDKITTPRVFGMVAGDLFTTNTLAAGDYTVGDKLMVGEDGILVAGEAAEGDHVFQVVKEYTLPDGQNAVKIQVIA